MTTTTASEPAGTFQRLRGHLAYLRLNTAAEALPGVLDAARDERLPVLDALECLMGIEADATAARKLASRLHFAALPAPWTIDDYDFSAQPGADDHLIRELATLRFLGEAANVVLIGPPGTGKTMLAADLAHADAEAGAQGHVHHLRRFRTASGYTAAPGTARQAPGARRLARPIRFGTPSLLPATRSARRK